MIDKAFHEVFSAINNWSIRWHEFRDVGIDEPYYGYYYAENQLYIIRDWMTDEYWFVKARSPKEALDAYKERLDYVMRAGAYCEEGE